MDEEERHDDKPTTAKKGLMQGHIENWTEGLSALDNFTPTQKRNMCIGLAALFALNGFSLVSEAIRKHRPTLKRNPNEIGLGSGFKFASKAFGRATLWAVGGVGILSLVVWKVMGVNSLPEFRAKVQSGVKSLPVPAVTPPANPGRSDFNSFKELFEYLETEDKKKAAQGGDPSSKTN
uniref:Transmembrane protein 242 n=1 Tax=Plectus sambesii TaxID=2011161 RepID=A0A914UQT5_9BILA